MEDTRWSSIIWRRFRRHRLGVVGAVVVAALYLVVAAGPFLAPYAFDTHHPQYTMAPPTRLHFRDEGRLRARPFVYATVRKRDPVTLEIVYAEDRSRKCDVQFFVRGEPYRLFGLKLDRHFFGLDPNSGCVLFPLGTDRFGRDMLARTLVGGQVSMTVGLFGIALSMAIGVVMGGLSGYYGGLIDDLIQRLVELLRSFPRLPLWLALSIVLPPQWSSVQVYFGVVTVLSLIGWTGVARVVRGLFLALREKEYVLAARAVGASDTTIIFRHILPNTASYLVVAGTLSLPGMILGESAISFLGLGIKEPMTSWGLLLKDAQSIEALTLYPWLLIPGVFIMVAVLAFNFLGDALRDAFDPFQTV